MPITTTKELIAAIEAIIGRRKKNQNKKKVNNENLPAGSPMYFDCIGCGDDIVVPENYTKKPTFCNKCQELNDIDWLK